MQSRDFHFNMYYMLHRLLRLFILRCRRRWLGVKPHHNKSKESGNHRPQAANPDPTAADFPAARVFIVSVVADGDFMLFFNVGEEGALVVNTVGKDSVLIGDGKACAVYSAIFGSAGWLQIEAVEGRKHGEFELQGVFGGDLERNIFVVNVFGDLNLKHLQENYISTSRMNADSLFEGQHTVSFLIR